MDKENVMIHTNTHREILFKIEENLVICDNIDESGGHYAKWNKPEREWQILFDVT